MTFVPFRFEALGDSDRAAFCCGEDVLDRYFQTQATQDIRRRIANCFVVVEAATGRVAAYYTLSAASIPLVDLPADETKRLPRYPILPAVRIGRLAVDRRFQRRGLGELMLMNAVHRTIQDAAAAFALLVDAKNDLAPGFYRRYGFRPIVGKPKTLFLPLATAQKTLREGKLTGSEPRSTPRAPSRLADNRVFSEKE
jgi:GNAT superfamily N-acetyltransferase